VIGNELEQEIISLYAKDTSSLYSINQIASKLGKTYPYINKKITRLIKNKIFKKTISGRAYLCSLNLDNDETIYLLILNEIKKKKQELTKKPELRKVMSYANKLKKLTGLQLVLKHKNKIIYVLENQQEKEQVQKASLRQVAQGHHATALTKKEFLGELLENKEIQENHVILYGYEKYYEYLKEIEDELKLRYSKLIP